jgi:hypothetical protein
MRALPEPILSADLKAEQIPVIRDWTDVIEFAGTFRPAVEFPAGSSIRGLSDIGDESDIAEIRAALFVEYRRYNHFGYRPPADVLDEARAAVERIRRQLP